MTKDTDSFYDWEIMNHNRKRIFIACIIITLIAEIISIVFANRILEYVFTAILAFEVFIYFWIYLSTGFE
jgi:hypothetical protein